MEYLFIFCLWESGSALLYRPLNYHGQELAKVHGLLSGRVWCVCVSMESFLYNRHDLSTLHVLPYVLLPAAFWGRCLIHCFLDEEAEAQKLMKFVEVHAANTWWSLDLNPSSLVAKLLIAFYPLCLTAWDWYAPIMWPECSEGWSPCLAWSDLQRDNHCILSAKKYGGEYRRKQKEEVSELSQCLWGIE